MDRRRLERDQAGWSSIEAMVALLIAVIAIGSLAAAGVNAFTGAARLRQRADAAIAERNGESDAIIELIGR